MCVRLFYMHPLETTVRVASLGALLFFTSFPEPALAYEHERQVARQHLAFVREELNKTPQVAGITQKYSQQTQVPAAGMKFQVTATAYSSHVSETDADPFTTASGSRARLGTMAANWLPLGSQVAIDGTVYRVEDRMSSRFGGEHIVDIWMKSPEMARKFGVRNLTVQIVYLPDR